MPDEDERVLYREIMDKALDDVRDWERIISDPNYKGDSPALENVPFGDDQYESESQSTALDIKQLCRAEGNTVRWNFWHEQLVIARNYYLWRGETELAANVDEVITDSKARHLREIAAKANCERK